MVVECPRCRAQNAPGSSFCTSCGCSLEGTLVQGRTIAIPAAAQAAHAPVQAAPAPIASPRPVLATPVLPGPSYPPPDPGTQREQVICVIDKSGSMNWPFRDGMIKLDAAKRANIALVLEKWSIDPSDEIGVVAFDKHAEVLLGLSPLHSHKSQIIQAIQSIQPGGGTDQNEGLKAARNMFDFDQPDVVRRIIELSDGCGGHPVRTSKKLKSKGVIIDVIGIGPDTKGVNERLLRKVASTVQGELHYWHILEQTSLVMTYQGLARKTLTGN